MPMHFTGGIAPGVSATLTAGDAGATSVPLTLSVAGGTIISWDLQEQHSSDDCTTWSGWASVATGLTSATYTATGLSPAPMRYRFQPVNILAQAEPTGNVVSVETEPMTFLPIMQNYTMVMPGSLNLGTAVNSSARSWCIDICPRRSPSALSFSRVRVGLLNNSRDNIYVCKHISVGRLSDSALTENASTGFVTLATDVNIPVGTGSLGTEALYPGIWRSAWHNITPSGGNGVRVAVELGANHPYHTWGSRPDYYGIGWKQGDTGLSNSLSSNWDVSSKSYTFGDHPLLFVEFDGLSESVVWLPVIGDSHFDGIGDENSPFRPFAVSGRLAQRWQTEGVKILPVNLARSGANTAQIAERLQWVADNFPVRAAIVQGFSINNISQNIPYEQSRTDWLAVEATEAGKRISILPMLGAGSDGIPAHTGWWPPMKTEQDWLISRRPETVTSIRTTVQDMTDGGYATGYVYTDGSHPNTAGYTQWEADSYAAIRAWCEAKAGQAL